MSVEDAIAIIGQGATGNESTTRLRVIDPVLAALRYDRDKDIVVEESDNSGQKPDYKLLGEAPDCQTGMVYIEAKAWHVSLSSLAPEVIRCALSYVNTVGARWLVLTNGHEWWLYDNRIQGTQEKKHVATADREHPAELCSLLTGLERGNVVAGK